MCGVVAVSAPQEGLDPALAAAIGSMTDVLAHRGPDSGAVRVLSAAALGHRRLSVIGLATGQQPMANEDGSVWVVFNGEIYNHRDVRSELESHGHVFRTTADTEVIVHGYEEWGAACVERFDGMFAFVLHDTRTRTTLAARDRLGKKPLFYADFGGQVHFASELKALKRSPRWTGEVDEDSLDAYLSLGYVPAPRTAYRGVYKLLPAHWMLHDANGITIRRYWDVQDFDQDHRDEAQIIEALDALLDGSVRRRLESEVPLGAFLSGGIDSGLVVSYMADAPGAAPITLTVGFTEDPNNELAAAQATAASLGTVHHAHAIRVDLASMLDVLARGFDEPFSDPSAVPTYHVCRAARDHVTVALSGDGGDETFSGYDFRYVPHMREERLRRHLGTGGTRLAAALASIWPRSPRLPRPLRLYNTLANLSGTPTDAFYRDLCFLKPEMLARLRKDEALRQYRESWAYALVRDAYERCPSPDALQRAQYADLTVYMPNDPLVKVDRMSMQHGLEVRCPLLDTKLVEFAFRVPAHVKTAGPQSKHLLRRVAARRLPPDVVNLPKRGFEAPIAVWLRGQAGQHFEDEVLRPGTWVTDRLSLGFLRARSQAHRLGHEDNSYLLWTVWMLHRWRTLDVASAHQGPAANHGGPVTGEPR